MPVTSTNALGSGDIVDPVQIELLPADPRLTHHRSSHKGARTAHNKGYSKTVVFPSDGPPNPLQALDDDDLPVCDSSSGQVQISIGDHSLSTLDNP